MQPIALHNKGSQGQAKPLSETEARELRRRYQQLGLAVGMLVSGTANTLTCKAAFSTSSLGHIFNHPFVQAGAMFSGEISCMLYYVADCYIRGKRIHRLPLRVFASFALPAWCDIIGTSTMYAGLTMTNASTYQMLRGSVVIFTGVMSRVLLRRATRPWQWCGMSLVFAGALVVGSTSVLQPDESQAAAGAGSNPLLGDVLVVGSQLFAALQMVLEETFVTGHNMPALQAVGCEGIWGMAGLLCVLAVLQQTGGATGVPIEDSVDAFSQICSSPVLVALLASNAFSIAFFNFFGISITKTSSAAYRVVRHACFARAVTAPSPASAPRLHPPRPYLSAQVLDSSRTGLVWLFGIATGAERFHLLQVRRHSASLDLTTRKSTDPVADPLTRPLPHASPSDRWFHRHVHGHDYVQRDAAHAVLSISGCR
tara:strand:+ start:1020 stop:2297 length:1278 start_codon:yes stop_codon:yes gene_type:complete